MLPPAVLDGGRFPRLPAVHRDVHARDPAPPAGVGVAVGEDGLRLLVWFGLGVREEGGEEVVWSMEDHSKCKCMGVREEAYMT